MKIEYKGCQPFWVNGEKRVGQTYHCGDKSCVIDCDRAANLNQTMREMQDAGFPDEAILEWRQELMRAEAAARARR